MLVWKVRVAVWERGHEGRKVLGEIDDVGVHIVQPVFHIVDVMHHLVKVTSRDIVESRLRWRHTLSLMVLGKCC